MHTNPVVRLVAPFAAVLVLLAACGGDDDDPSASSTSTSTSLEDDTLDGAAGDRPFPFLGTAPHSAHHVNPRNADFYEAAAPFALEEAWSALDDVSVPHPCAEGPEGNLYCTTGWDLASGRCNLHALDGATGRVLWRDDPDGVCLLDEYAWTTNPLVDVDGNVYASDSRQIASFTAAGELRWVNEVPASLAGERANNPFSLQMLPTGEIVTATMGDAYVLVVDRETGALMAPPLDVPSAKARVDGPIAYREGFMDGVMGDGVGRQLYDVGLGVSGNENDNGVGVDPVTGLVFVTGGAPAPNPENDGGVWAIRYTPPDGVPAPGACEGGESEGCGTLEVAFSVTIDGGSGTTPTITDDGSLVLVGDDTGNLIAIDAQACLDANSDEPGGTCEETSSVRVGDFKVAASVSVSPDDRVVVPVSTAGLFAYDLERTAPGEVAFTPVWTTTFEGLTISGVVAGFDNVVWLPLTRPATGEHWLVGVDAKTGEEVTERIPARDVANVTLLDDGRLLTVNIGFFDNLLAPSDAPLGVQAWRPIDG